MSTVFSNCSICGTPICGGNNLSYFRRSSEFHYPTTSTKGSSQDKYAPALAAYVAMTVISILSALASILLAINVFQNRRTKTLKATGVITLMFLLLGCGLLSLSALTAMWLSSATRCILTNWLLHLGIGIIDASISLHAWRIAVVLDFSKLRRTRINNRELMKRKLVIISIVVFYLSVSSAFMSNKLKSNKNEPIECSIFTWDYFIFIGHFTLIVWGIFQCVRARHAPKLYNLSTASGIVLYNTFVCLLFLLVVMLLKKEFKVHAYSICIFIFTTAVVYPAQGFLVIKRLRTLRNSSKDISVSVSDISGEARTHRLTLRVDKHGRVQTLNCIPCGPMRLVDDEVDEEVYEHCNGGRRDVGKGDMDDKHKNYRQQEVFRGYTEEEFDRLVDMFQRLKSENYVLNRRLQSLHRRSSGSCANTSVATTPGDENRSWRGRSSDTLHTLLGAASSEELVSSASLSVKQSQFVDEPAEACISGFEQVLSEHTPQRQFTNALTNPLLSAASSSPAVQRNMFPLTRMPKSLTFAGSSIEQQQLFGDYSLGAIPERESYQV